MEGDEPLLPETETVEEEDRRLRENVMRYLRSREIRMDKMGPFYGWIHRIRKSVAQQSDATVAFKDFAPFETFMEELVAQVRRRNVRLQRHVKEMEQAYNFAKTKDFALDKAAELGGAHQLDLFLVKLAAREQIARGYLHSAENTIVMFMVTMEEVRNRFFD